MTAAIATVAGQPMMATIAICWKSSVAKATSRNLPVERIRSVPTREFNTVMHQK